MASSAHSPDGWKAWAAPLPGSRCAGCRGPGGPLCRPCRAALQRPPFAAHVVPAPPGLPRVMSAAVYAGPVREAVVAFKDHGRWALNGVLGAALGRAVAQLLLDEAQAGAGPARARVVLVPAPGSPGSARRRDGDHVQELAVVAARHLRGTGLDVAVRPLLAPVRRRRDQVGLRREERAANLSGSVAALPAAARAHGLSVVLVDDLVTTGATLAECARALREAGVRPAGAAVVASAERGMRASAAPSASRPDGSTFVL